MKNTQKTDRAEKYLATGIKNLRESVKEELSMEDFVRANLQLLFGLEREEYLAENPTDKGNGFYPRSLRSLIKDGITVKIPRTRNNDFAPVALELCRLSAEQMNELALTLLQKGMTTRDTSDVMRRFFGSNVSHTTIDQLTQEFGQLRSAWEKSPLERTYQVIYADALQVTVRRGDRYAKEAVCVIYGVTLENTRELLAISINPTESAAEWKEVFENLKQRGVENITLAVADGLPGLPEAIQSVFPATRFQVCVVHKKRNILRKTRPRDKKAVAEDLKEVFNNFENVDTVSVARDKLTTFIDRWRDRYDFTGHFDEETVDHLFTYISFPPEVRRMIYTTNSIENVNRAIRKATKNKLSFESPERLLDYIFVVIKDFESKHWQKPVWQYNGIIDPNMKQ